MEIQTLKNGVEFVDMVNDLGSLSGFAKDKVFFKYGFGITPEEGYRKGKKIASISEWKGGGFYKEASDTFGWK